MGAKTTTVQRIWDAARPLAASQGVSIWDVTFQKQGPDFYLTVIIDKEGGVGIDDCERMSRALDPLLDEMDLIDQSYCLSVSSPGLSRLIRTDEQMQRYIGNKVRVRLIRPDADNRRDHAGVLTAFDEESVLLDNSLRLTRKETAWIKADDDDWEETK